MNHDEFLVHQDTHTKDNTWWLNDARGIPCARVCIKCLDYVSARYRPEVMTDPNYEADEPIDPQD